MDNLKQLVANVDTAIPLNGGVASVKTENHNPLEKEIIGKVGKMTGFPFTSKRSPVAGIVPSGSFFWNGTPMNQQTTFELFISKYTLDGNYFTRIADLIDTGALMHFKDFVGRSTLFEVQDVEEAIDANNNEYLILSVKGFAENLDYTYLIDEEENCMLEFLGNFKGADFELERIGDIVNLKKEGEIVSSIDISANKLISVGNITVTGNNVTVPDASAKINGIVYSKPTPTVLATPYTTPSYKRIDILEINNLSQVVRKQGTETLATAIQIQPTVSANAVLITTVYVSDSIIVTPPTVGNNYELSIRNKVGEEQFKATNFIGFDGFGFDPVNKTIKADTLTPFTVFIDSVNGNNTLGQIENKSKPFQTDIAAYAALPVDDGTEWTLLYIDNNVTRQMSIVPNRNIKIQCLGTGTFNWSISDTYVYLGASKYFTLDVKKCSVTITSSVASAFNLASSTIIVNANSFTYTGSILGTSGFFRGLATIDIVTFTSTTTVNILGCDGIVTIANLRLNGGASAVVDNGVVTSLIININKITKLNSGGAAIALIAGGAGAKFVVNIKEIRGTGSFNFKGSGGKEIDINFSSFDYDSTISIGINGSNAGGKTTLRGTSSLTNELILGTGAGIKNIKFENFIGRLSSLPDSNSNTYTFNNSTIQIANSFITGTSINSTAFNGSNSILSDNPNFLFTGITSESIFTINGILKTNFTSYGQNVTAIDLGLTFKEKSKEIIVRNKVDIINKVLSSNITYIIDGTINLLSDEYIVIPSTGLTIKGYGFDVSAITKNVAGQSIYTSQSGGSGNFVCMEMQYNSGAGSVFDITDVNGTNAIEINDINFNNCNSIGKIKGYRQFTGLTVGVYGCSNGFTLSGNWNGFSLSKLHVRTLASTGTLFKKDTDTVFSNRFLLDSANVSGVLGIKLLDFDNTIFNKDELLQITNSVFEVAGVINESNTAALIPNITANDNRSKWTNSTGITLTALKFLDMKSPDGNIWRLEVSNAGAITTTDI